MRRVCRRRRCEIISGAAKNSFNLQLRNHDGSGGCFSVADQKTNQKWFSTACGQESVRCV